MCSVKNRCRMEKEMGVLVLCVVTQILTGEMSSRLRNAQTFTGTFARTR